MRKLYHVELVLHATSLFRTLPNCVEVLYTHNALQNNVDCRTIKSKDDKMSLSIIASCLLFFGTAMANFPVFDCTAYTNATIGYGTSNINWIPNYVCSPIVDGGKLPTKAQWQSIVLEWNVHPGFPLVLDCENLYLDSSSTADAHLATMKTLQTWAAGVVPSGQIIGWYGLVQNTDSSLQDHYRDLIANHSSHAFFPSAYTYVGKDLAAWNATLNSAISNANAIESSLPLWVFVWPQYHDSPNTFYSVDGWTARLNLLRDKAAVDGVVIWGGKNHAVCDSSCQMSAGSLPWLKATRTYLTALYGLYGDSPQKSGAQVFVGV